MIRVELVKFILAGGTAALANIAARAAFSLVLPYVPAIVLAYCVGMVTAFVLNRMFVFRGATRPLGHQAAWFILVNLAAVVQTVVISLVLRDWLLPAIGMHFHPDTVAHVIGVIVPVFTSYLGHKHLTFKGAEHSR